MFEEEKKIKDIAELLGSNKPSKLTDWKNEPTVDELMADYTEALPNHQSQMKKIAEWVRLLQAESDPTQIKKGRSGIVPKVIRRLAEWRYATISSPFLNEKHLFSVEAQNAKYLSAAIQNDFVLNYQLASKLDRVKFIGDLIRTAVNEGTAIVRTGWETEYQLKEREESVYEYVRPDPMIAEQIMMTLQQLEQEMQETGIEYAEDTQTYQSVHEEMRESLKISMEYQEPVQAINTGETQIIKEEKQIKNQPVVQVIDNRQLIIDPSCEGDFSKARFAIYTYNTSLSELRQAGIYKHLDRLEKNIDSLMPELRNENQIMNAPDDVFYSDGKTNSNSKFRFKDNPRKRLTALEYWGYWDIDGTGIVQGFVATIVNNVLIRLERNPFPDSKLPFIVIPYLPVKGSVYGEPDGELVKDNQQIITALTRSIIDINARSANGQVAMPKGFLDIPNTQKFRKGEDYEYNPTGMHPAEAIFMHTANEIPQSIMLLLQGQYAEAESATGVKSFQNGLDANAYGQVQAGMSQAITAMTTRESDIIYRITRGLEEVGNKIISMNQEWLSEEEVIAVTKNQFATIRRDDLQGEFNLFVSVKSNSESEGKAQQLTFMAQTLGQDADWGLRKMMMLEIGRLYNLDTFTSALQAYEPQPDPVQQELAQLEIDLQKAKIAEEESKAAVNRAKEKFILAQIGNVQADTDLKNLDFLEQQEGVKHERQKEIVESQAYAQNQGKIATELLKADTARRNAKDKALSDKEIAQINADAKKKAQNNEGKKNKSGLTSNNKFVDPETMLERATTPKGLNIVDGLGNYFKTGGNDSVGNVT